LEIFANNNLKIYLVVNVFPLFLRLTVVYFLSYAGCFPRHWTDVTRGVSGAGPAGKREKIRAAGPGGRFFKEKVEKGSPISWIFCIFTLYEALRDYLFVSLLVDAPAGSAEQSLRD
jgi:hypothetical protein